MQATDAPLTTEQLAAVTSTARWTHIDAGPGTGKTTTLAARARWLAEHEPGPILCLVFTRSAAEQMQAKIGDVADVATFHGFAARHTTLRVASEAQADAAVRSLFTGPDRLPAGRQKELGGLRAVQRELVAYEAEGVTSKGVARVCNRLFVQGLVSTWELPVHLWLARGAVDRYKHILVDESQDCTPMEARIAWALVVPGGTLTTVGDERQAIFGWRGARGEDTFAAEHRERFVRGSHYETKAVHYLTRSHRFGFAIGEEANRVATRMGAAPIRGSDLSKDIGRVVEATWPDAKDIGHDLAFTRAILCRTNIECERIAADLGDVAVCVRRDRTVPMDHEADRFADVAAAGKVAVATVHSAKGREWDAVWVVDHPSYHTGDVEELCVLYVAITRARRLLVRVKS